jgi:hypothetical protein
VILDLREALVKLCGCEILTITLEEHVADGSRSLVSVWVALPDGGLRFRTAPNGWGLAVDATPPAPTDLAEHGRIELTDGQDFRNLRAGVVRTAAVVRSEESAVPVGVCWTVNQYDAVVVYSYDDELFVGPTLSGDLGTTTYDQVCRGT